MAYEELEDKIIEAIRQCCPDEDDKKNALRYFKNTTVNEMIEQALED